MARVVTPCLLVLSTRSAAEPLLTPVLLLAQYASLAERCLRTSPSMYVAETGRAVKQAPPSQPGAVSAQTRICLLGPGRVEGRYLLNRLYGRTGRSGMREKRDIGTSFSAEIASEFDFFFCHDCRFYDRPWYLSNIFSHLICSIYPVAKQHRNLSLLGLPASDTERLHHFNISFRCSN